MKKLFISILCLFLLTSCDKTIDSVHDYIPYANIPENYSLEDAKNDGLVVYEDFDITAGQSIWDSFIKKTKNGEPCTVRLMFYYTLDGQGITPAHEQYEEIKDNYPVFYIQDLIFDGKVYTLYSVEEDEEYTFKYKYLKWFREEPVSDGATYSEHIRYVLVNDDTVTWDQIWKGMISSQSGAWIDHKTVYSKYNYDNAE